MRHGNIVAENGLSPRCVGVRFQGTQADVDVVRAVLHCRGFSVYKVEGQRQSKKRLLTVGGERTQLNYLELPGRRNRLPYIPSLDF